MKILQKPSTPTDASRFLSESKSVWLGLLLIAATLVAYSPVIFAGFIWDDDAYVTENTLLTAPDGLGRIWFSAHSQSQYFPLVFTTLRLEHALWGLNPVGYHLVNIAFHIANALLVWGLLRRLALPGLRRAGVSPRTDGGLERESGSQASATQAGAWLAAAVFALHPVQVETVAWVTELKNTESTFFYLLTLFAWMKFCEGRGRRFYALALFLSALALFAKTTACTLSAALLLVLWIKNEPLRPARFFQTLPFLVIGLGMGLVSVWWESHLGNYDSKLQLLGGPLERLLIATQALWFYAGKIFWPANLTFSYPRWQINLGEARQYLGLAGCIAVAAWLWFARNRFGRRPLAALIFFVAALSPMLGFIPLYTFYFSYVADHYQYLACLGLIALVTGRAVNFFEARPIDRRVPLTLAGLLLVTLTALTWQQCHIYKNLDTLWADTLQKNPRSWMAHANLARIQATEGKFAEAEGHYLAAYAIAPENEVMLYNYGNMLTKLGRYDEAILFLQRATQAHANYPEAHNNLGVVLFKKGAFADAAAECQIAVRLRPSYAEAFYNLSVALAKQQKTDEAITAIRQALVLKPDSEPFRNWLNTLSLKIQPKP